MSDSLDHVRFPSQGVVLIVVFLSTNQSTEVPHCDQFMSQVLSIKILKSINNS